MGSGARGRGQTEQVRVKKGEIGWVGCRGEGMDEVVAFMDMEVKEAVEPFAPASEAAAHEFVSGRASKGEFFGTEIVMSDLVFINESEHGLVEDATGEIAIAGELDEAEEERIEIGILVAAEGPEQVAPGEPGLEVALRGKGDMGVFPGGKAIEVVEPSLEFEGGDIEGIVFPFGQGEGIVQGIHDWKRRRELNLLIRIHRFEVNG